MLLYTVRVSLLFRQVDVRCLCVAVESPGRSNPKKWNIKALFSRKAVKGQFLFVTVCANVSKTAYLDDDDFLIGMLYKDLY